MTFPPGGLPPVLGFWSLTLYNEHHFLHPNELNRYSLGTKNKNLHLGRRRVANPAASARRRRTTACGATGCPPLTGRFSLYLRAYWPEQDILDGTWTPPPVTRLG